MNTLFPKMCDCPKGSQIAVGGLYWVVYQIVLSFILSLMIASLHFDGRDFHYLLIAYYIVNLLMVLLIFRKYLIDSFWAAKLDPKGFFSSVGLGLAVLVVLEIPILLFHHFAGDFLQYTPLPIAEPLLGNPVSVWLPLDPLLIGALMVFAAPVVTGCLYYAVGFAAAAQERPWLGYLIVALLSAIPAVLLITSYGHDVARAAIIYASTLPFHLCACWVYQRTDSIWGPILFHAVTNIFGVPISLFLTYGSFLSYIAA